MDDISEQYAQLLRDGETLNAYLMSNVELHTEWHRAIEELADADGLRVNPWTEMIGAGSFHVPHALLARPDGCNYSWLTDDYQWVQRERDNALRAIEGDWGEVLRAARARSGRAASQERDA